MTTTAASNAVKDKVEKRRALGRGLESLLPGPRVVRPADAAAGSSGATGQQQVPHSVRNDKADEAEVDPGYAADADAVPPPRFARLDGRMRPSPHPFPHPFPHPSPRLSPHPFPRLSLRLPLHTLPSFARMDSRGRLSLHSLLLLRGMGSAFRRRLSHGFRGTSWST